MTLLQGLFVILMFYWLMKEKWYILSLFLFFPMFISGIDAKKNKETSEVKGLSVINRNAAEAYVGFLASDCLEGRESGTRGGRIAGNYIISLLKEAGALPLFEDDYVQSFEAYSIERRQAPFTVEPEIVEKLKKNVHRVCKLRNILAKIDGENPDEIVIVGAHYDHLGIDPMLVGDNIFNGADDNASGVQAVLQILKAFIETGKQPSRTVVFAFWDGEERGLLGSQYFVRNFIDMNKVKGYMNFDMIGRNNMEHRPQHFNLLYLNKDSVFAKWMKDDIDKYHLQLDPDLKPADDFSGGSDQAPFFKAGVPIVWYQTGAQPDFHMPTDEVDRINWDKMVEITKSAFLCLWKMANENY